MGNRYNRFPEDCPEEQRHDHELQGSVRIAEPQEEPHNHRFATVTGEAIPVGPNNHVHDVMFRTDFFNDHFHTFVGRTGGAIPVGNRHVHFINSMTSVNDGHRHAFEAATMIDNPIGTEENNSGYEQQDEIGRRNDNYRRN